MENQFNLNRTKLIELMENKSILLLNSGKAPHKTTDQYFPYLPHKSFYYLTGIEEENCQLVIIKGEVSSDTYLFIEETTEFMRLWVGEKMSAKEASTISDINIKNIKYNKDFSNFFKGIMSYARGSVIEVPNSLYLDLYRVKPTIEPVALNQFQEILKVYKELNILNINKHLSLVRMFKYKEEIEKLQTAISITNKGLKRIMKELSNRDNEYQIEADFNHEITLNGADGLGFNTILASGDNGTVLHYEDNNSPLEDGKLLLCDLGALKNNYGADISRTYPINGKYSERQKQIYEIVLQTNKKSIEFVKPGITWKELNDFARNLLIKGCKEIGLIKEDKEITKYYYHTIGHFLGLDTHDIGHYNLKIAEGMVITIEPGLYIKEEGIGIRIEDDILVTKDGRLNLSKEIIKEICDIEKFMK
jgi:Xaa-Pro aminopeptidase